MKTRMGNLMLGAMVVILVMAGAGYADLSDGLVAYYPFNGNTNDESGGGYHLTAYNGATFTPDRFGNVNGACYLDGINDWIGGNSYDLVTGNQGSYAISFWFSPLSNWDSSTNPNSSLVGNEEDGSWGDWFVMTPGGSGIGLYYWVCDEVREKNTIVEFSTDSWDAGMWYHLVVNYEVSTETLTLWVNGDLKVTRTVPEDTGRDTGGDFLLIGRYVAQHTDMRFDELRLYNRALSPEEIGQLINSAPVVTITSPSSGFLAPVNTPVTFAGLIDDPDVGDTHAAVWTITSESGSEYRDGTVSGGSVNDSFQFSQAGIYSISLTVTDAAGESDTATTVNGLPAFIVVYDPSAGFVTGGGWIYSPAGSLLDSSAAGKATFGFVAKYKQGATTPQGNTEFHFQAGDFRFKSSSYDWLVIAGSKAMFKGEGYIEGMGGGFKFMLTAVDSTEDKFRIKIWNPLTEDVIYDNKRGENDEAEPTTIGGGSIVIHKK